MQLFIFYRLEKSGACFAFLTPQHPLPQIGVLLNFDPSSSPLIYICSAAKLSRLAELERFFSESNRGNEFNVAFSKVSFFADWSFHVKTIQKVIQIFHFHLNFFTSSFTGQVRYHRHFDTFMVMGVGTWN